MNCLEGGVLLNFFLKVEEGQLFIRAGAEAGQPESEPAKKRIR